MRYCNSCKLKLSSDLFDEIDQNKQGCVTTCKNCKKVNVYRNESNLKFCYLCKQELSKELFGKNKSKPDGLSCECKSCKSIKDKKYREENESKLKERRHQYYLNNTEIIKTKSTVWSKNNLDKKRVYSKIAKNKIKLEVFSYYCENEVKCKCCNVNNLEVLSIDHINGGGTKHRLEIFGCVGGGKRFYFWLKKNNYPEGYQILCFNCQYRKRSVEMRPENPTEKQIHHQKYVESIKEGVFNGYGGCKCCHCEETELSVLSLDHINNDGAEHRRITDKKGFAFYLMLKRNNYPNDPPLQVMCMNCQILKRNEKYAEGKNGSSDDNSCSTVIV